MVSHLTLSVTGVSYWEGIKVTEVFGREQHTPLLTHHLYMSICGQEKKELECKLCASVTVNFKLSSLTNLHTHAHIRTHAHTHTHARTHARTHTHTHTHTYTHTHTHTFMNSFSKLHIPQIPKPLKLECTLYQHTHMPYNTTVL